MQLGLSQLWPAGTDMPHKQTANLFINLRQEGHMLDLPLLNVLCPLHQSPLQDSSATVQISLGVRVTGRPHPRTGQRPKNTWLDRQPAAEGR